ncbi:hypothetical protein K490DRAFT_62279 [Saccharata proteae CBS 121410]|uniref:Uncharacterized protein n=1 Tax=Saccharata proteae CBS 121410 TaxID=1314787 RepID=A0A9P4HZW2_9PEZI|nr:hypothetical protein K490DRAFT_62279 [Saccharata proteae CBS 121410]
MKTLFLSLSILASLFLGVFAAPVVKFESRDAAEACSAYSIMNELYMEVQKYTGSINTTAAGINSDSTTAQNLTAAASFRSSVNGITSAIKDATIQTKSLRKRSLFVRQEDTVRDLAGLVENILLELGGALDRIADTLGLSSLLGALSPLISALSDLLLGLEEVVHGLLTVVEELLDGLLSGLRGALAGLM